MTTTTDTVATDHSATRMLLDPGMNLTLRPMRYPHFYDRYRDAIKNTWTVEEVDFATDVHDLRAKMSDAERHLVAVVVEAVGVGVGVGGIRLRQCRQGRRAAAEQRKCRRRYSRRGCMWVQVQMQAMQCRMVCTTVLRCSGRQVGMLGFGVCT